MKISPSLQWIAPYLLDVKHIIDLSKIVEIKAKKVGIKSKTIHVGLTLLYPNGEFKIILNTNYQRWHFKKQNGQCVSKLKEYSLIDLLTTLAHELAHVLSYTFDHTPQHKIDECRINICFMKRLLEEDYISEEDEVCTLKKCE